MQPSPEIRFHFKAGYEPEVFIDGCPVSPRARTHQEGRELPVLDLVLAWARDEARSEAERDRALNYIRYYIDELR
jgi:hypothetical protein